MSLNLEAYAYAALRTKAAHNDLVCAALGLTGESGEFADLIKKHRYHAQPLDRDEAIKELGDVLWYVALGADQLGVTLDEVAQRNLTKLAKRYPKGFTAAASLARADDAAPHRAWPASVRVLGAAGIVSAALSITGGFLGVTELIGAGAAVMLAANLYALVWR